MFGVFGSFRSYVFWSFTLTCSVIAHAFYHKQYFYRSTVYLYHSKFAALACANLALALVLLLGRILQTIFLGRLRYRERERLQYRIKESIIETCLAVTVFREDFSIKFVSFFTILLFMKIFHWLAKDRVELLEEQPLSPLISHVRLLGLMGLLVVVDLWLVMWCVGETYRSQGPTILVLFAFEFTVLIIELVSNFVKYCLNTIDGFHDGNWDGKLMMAFYNELLSDMCQLTVYVGLFCYVHFFYSLPLHILRDLYMTFAKLRKRCKAFLRYRRVLATMDERLEDATEEELEAGDRTCIICREEMRSAKKLPCGHLFCLKCLKGWLGRQETCPTCRTAVDMSVNRGGGGGNGNNGRRGRNTYADPRPNSFAQLEQRMREQFLRSFRASTPANAGRNAPMNLQVPVNLHPPGENMNGGRAPMYHQAVGPGGQQRPNTLGATRAQLQPMNPMGQLNPTMPSFAQRSRAWQPSPPVPGATMAGIPSTSTQAGPGQAVPGYFHPGPIYGYRIAGHHQPVAQRTQQSMVNNFTPQNRMQSPTNFVRTVPSYVHLPGGHNVPPASHINPPAPQTLPVAARTLPPAAQTLTAATETPPPPAETLPSPAQAPPAASQTIQPTGTVQRIGGEAGAQTLSASCSTRDGVVSTQPIAAVSPPSEDTVQRAAVGVNTSSSNDENQAFNAMRHIGKVSSFVHANGGGPDEEIEPRHELPVGTYTPLTGQAAHNFLDIRRIGEDLRCYGNDVIDGIVSRDEGLIEICRLQEELRESLGFELAHGESNASTQHVRGAVGINEAALTGVIEEDMAMTGMPGDNSDKRQDENADTVGGEGELRSVPPLQPAENLKNDFHDGHDRGIEDNKVANAVEGNVPENEDAIKGSVPSAAEDQAAEMRRARLEAIERRQKP